MKKAKGHPINQRDSPKSESAGSRPLAPLPTARDSAFFSWGRTEEGGGGEKHFLFTIVPNSAAAGAAPRAGTLPPHSVLRGLRAPPSEPGREEGRVNKEDWTGLRLTPAEPAARVSVGSQTSEQIYSPLHGVIQQVAQETRTGGVTPGGAWGGHRPGRSPCP